MALPDSFGTLPVVDVGPLLSSQPAGVTAVARQIEAACRDHGFFYVTGHGVAPDLLARLEEACAAFFALPEAEKMQIAMARGGPAWRGYFPVGAELTSGQPDLKEGLYFGAELPDDDPRVRAGLPLHGRNLFPAQVPGLRGAVLAYLDALTGLGQAVLRGVALSLGLDADYFAAGHTARDPAAARAGRGHGGRPAALGRPEPARVHRHLRRLPARPGVKGVSAAPAAGAHGRGALTRAALTRAAPPAAA